MGWIFIIISAATVIVFRIKRPDAPRPYKAFGYPLTTIMFCLTLLFFVINILIQKPVQSSAGIVLLLIGLPVYYYFHRKKQNARIQFKPIVLKSEPMKLSRYYAMDKIAIVLPVHNRKDDTMNCLRQLQDIKMEGFQIEVVIIDDGSTDGTAEAVSRAYPDATILQGDGNLWWAGGVNTGFEYALQNDHDFVYTTNDDIEYFSDTLQVLYDTLKDKRDAVCCSTFLRKGNGDYVVYAGFRSHGFFKRLRSPIRGPYLESYAGQIVEADTLSTKSTLIPNGIIKDVGYFDSKHFPHNYSDFNFFERVKRKGYALLVNMDSRIYTEGSDVSYHQIVLNSSLKDITKTFFDKKYGNHWKTVYNRATVGEGFIKGHIILIGKIYPYLYWLLMRILLPRKKLKELMVKKGKISIE